jgi:hypothetical protein
MSKVEDKEKHSKRLHDTQTHVKRQVDIAKAFGAPIKEPNKFAKKHALNCGNPNCTMCANPRKFGEETKQELSFKQTQKWNEDD